MNDEKELLVQELAENSKLNKQKKTLRVLNVLTALLLILAVVIVPISFSRYSSTVACESSTSIASMGCRIDYTTNSIGWNNLSVSTSNVYCFIEQFEISNETSEVSLKFDLKIKLANYQNYSYDNPGTLNATSLKPQSLGTRGSYNTPNSANNGWTSFNISTTTNGKYSSLNTNKAYYALSMDGSNYTWYEESLVGNELTFSSLTDSQKTMLYNSNVKCYFKVIIFIRPNTSSSSKLENCNILYNLTTTQVD